MSVFQCIEDEDIQKIKCLDVNEKGSCGFTPLMVACFAGSGIEVIKHFVENGADVNESGDCGYTALMCLIVSIDSDSIDKFEYLIEHGADVNKRDNKGETFVDKFVRYSKHLNYDKDIFDSIIKLGRNNKRPRV
jgi:ankyrin repeat protein